MLDDNRVVLQQVAQVVRVVAAAMLGVTLSLVAVMAGLVLLTVRAALKAQAGSVAVLKFLGGADALVAELVLGQLVKRALWGWFFACVVFAMCFGVAGLVWPVLQAWWLVPAVWFAAFGAAASLVLVTALVAKFSTLKIVRQYG